MPTEYLDINGLRVFKEEEDKLLSQKQDTLTPTTIADGNITTSLGFDAAGNVVKGQGQQKKILTFTSAELETFATNLGSMLEFNMPISAYTSEFQDADAITLQSEDASTINFTLYRVQLLHDGESDTDIAAFVGSAVIPGLNTYDFVLLNGTITVKARLTIKEYSTETQYNKYDICLYTGTYYLCNDATRGAWDSSKWTALSDVAAMLTTPVQTLALETNLALLQKQDTLVSGTNIKTINGNSILGNGNLTIDTVTETRVQEMIDASINSAIGGKY